VEDLDSIPGLGRSPGEEKGYPLQYSGLQNSMDCVDHGITKSQTQLSNFLTHTHTHRYRGQEMGFPCGLAGKESACNARDLVSIPGV